MTPRIICSACEAELQRSDKFCPSCGTSIDWGFLEAPAVLLSSVEPTIVSTGSISCKHCGNKNSAEAIVCFSCGVTLRAGTTHNASKKTNVQTVAKNSSGQDKEFLRSGFLQSWKLTAAIGVIFIVVIVIAVASREPNGHVHEEISPAVKQTIETIDVLQKQVEANPNDLPSTLKLANLLHDVKFYPRAVMEYERYLKARPDDVDARVDMGVCFFEMGVTDSLRGEEFLQKAISEIKVALTRNPKHQLGNFNLGIVYLQSGNLEESRKWFKKCIEIDPNSTTGKQAEQIYSQHQFNNPS